MTNFEKSSLTYEQLIKNYHDNHVLPCTRVFRACMEPHPQNYRQSTAGLYHKMAKKCTSSWVLPHTISIVSIVLQILQHIFMLWHSRLLHFESKGCFVLLKPSMHRHFFHPQKLLVPGISPRIPSIQLHYQWVCATNWCKWSETRCKLLQGNTLVRKFRAI